MDTKILALALIPLYKEETTAVIICVYRQELTIAVFMVPTVMIQLVVGILFSPIMVQFRHPSSAESS